MWIKSNSPLLAIYHVFLAIKKKSNTNSYFFYCSLLVRPHFVRLPGHHPSARLSLWNNLLSHFCTLAQLHNLLPMDRLHCRKLLVRFKRYLIIQKLIILYYKADMLPCCWSSSWWCVMLLAPRLDSETALNWHFWS